MQFLLVMIINKYVMRLFNYMSRSFHAVYHASLQLKTIYHRFDMYTVIA